MGLNDGLANVLGLLAQPHVSGTMTALSNQLIVLFSAIAAFFLLGTRYHCHFLISLSASLHLHALQVYLLGDVQHPHRARWGRRHLDPGPLLSFLGFDIGFLLVNLFYFSIDL